MTTLQTFANLLQKAPQTTQLVHLEQFESALNVRLKANTAGADEHTTSTSTNDSSKHLTDVVELPISQTEYPKTFNAKEPGNERFKVLQKWQGYVIEVYADSFLARLVPIAGEGNDQDADILLDTLDDVEKTLVEPGAVFYWSIGYHDSGGRKQSSQIRFRRLPVWKEADQQRADAIAKKLAQLFDGK